VSECRCGEGKSESKGGEAREKHYCDDETTTAAAETIEDTRHIVCHLFIRTWCLLQRVINSWYNHNLAASEEIASHISTIFISQHTHTHTRVYIYIYIYTRQWNRYLGTV
jgi:hypothetical protein